jgi:DNA-directed RNA polymerase specialized sigma24 family protein
MNWRELSDQRLVELCLEGNEGAWSELLERYKRLILRVITKTLRIAGIAPTASLLEDRFNDCLMRILTKDCRALRELKWLHEGSLRGLLVITASTATQDWVRKEFSEKRDKNKEVPIADMDEVKPASHNVISSGDQKILLDQLMNCLANVTRDEADCKRNLTIFLLFYSYGITAADVAKIYEMNLRKVENTLARLARLARSHCL